MGNQQHSIYGPDRGEATATDGLVRCKECKSIAGYHCPKCRTPICDTQCMSAHRLDHPAFAVTGPIPKRELCATCERPLTSLTRPTYCSEECYAAGNRERSRMISRLKRVLSAA